MVSKMKKHKVMPDDLVTKYLRLTAKITPLEKELKPIKERVLQLYDKGYTHPSLRFTDVDRANIPWKTLCDELLHEVYGDDEKKCKRWYKKLEDRFPREPIAPRIEATGV